MTAASTPVSSNPQQAESVTCAAFVQRSMFAMALRHRRAPLNVMILAWRVQGPLSIEVLQIALDAVVARHPTLRSRLRLSAGQLMQETFPPPQVAIEFTCVDAPTADARFDAAKDLLRQGGLEPIDVTASPVPKCRLLRLEADDHLLCLYVHHAMCDGWSSRIILRDLAAFMEARASGQQAMLPPIPVQCADISRQQIEASEHGGYLEEIRVWKKELADLPPRVGLPCSAERKGNRDFFARSPLHVVPAEVYASLRETARQMRVSPFSLLLSTLTTLVHQRTRATDLLIGVPTLNRWSSQEMQYVGCATSLLPARLRPRGGFAFTELCAQTHVTLRRLLANGRIPLEVLLRETMQSPIRGADFPIWSQIGTATAPAEVPTLALKLVPLLVERGTLLADLDLDMLESDGGLQCEFAYRSSLFEPGLIRDLMADFGVILRQAIQTPAMTVEALCGLAGRGT